MKISVYNLKGGVGKTSIALNLALRHGFAIVTNDVYSPLERVLPEKQLLKVDRGEKLPDFPDGYRIIFDLGGYVDKIATGALKQSRWVLVPTVNEFIDLQITIDCVGEIQGLNPNVVLLVNRTIKGDFEAARSVLSKFFSYPIFEVKRSKALPHIFREKKPVEGMVEEGGLKAYNYSAVADQFAEIAKFIGA